MTNLDSILKSRDITLPTKIRLVKAMVSPVVMYECKSWTIKKAECWRIDAFELWCWRRLLRVPWAARRSKESFSVHPKWDQFWMFIGSIDIEAETPIFWPPDAKSWLIWKDPDSGKDWKQARGRQRMRWLECITDLMDVHLGGLWELVMNREACRAMVHGVSKCRTQLSNLTELNWTENCYSMSSSNYCFLTCIQIPQEAIQVVRYSQLLKNFSVFLWSTQSKALA